MISGGTVNGLMVSDTTTERFGLLYDIERPLGDILQALETSSRADEAALLRDLLAGDDFIMGSKGAARA